MLEVYILMIVD